MVGESVVARGEGRKIKMFEVAVPGAGTKRAAPLATIVGPLHGPRREWTGEVTSDE